MGKVMVMDKSDKIRCDYCGIEGVYGIDIVDTDWYNERTKHDTLKFMCKDVKACFERKWLKHESS